LFPREAELSFAQQTLALKIFPAKRALRPGMSLPALRPGVVFASHASTDALQCLASADDLRRLASSVL